MKIILADHFGICFGVRDAIAQAEALAAAGPLTILGELVHNPVVRERLRAQNVDEIAPDLVQPFGAYAPKGCSPDKADCRDCADHTGSTGRTASRAKSARSARSATISTIR